MMEAPDDRQGKVETEPETFGAMVARITAEIEAEFGETDENTRAECEKLGIICWDDLTETLSDVEQADVHREPDPEELSDTEGSSDEDDDELDQRGAKTKFGIAEQTHLRQDDLTLALLSMGVTGAYLESAMCLEQFEMMGEWLRGNVKTFDVSYDALVGSGSAMGISEMLTGIERRTGLTDFQWWIGAFQLFVNVEK